MRARTVAGSETGAGAGTGAGAATNAAPVLGAQSRACLLSGARLLGSLCLLSRASVVSSACPLSYTIRSAVTFGAAAAISQSELLLVLTGLGSGR